MYHSFTGSSRRQRHVNLSGQPPSTRPNSSSAIRANVTAPKGHTAVAQAQVNRLHRGLERDRLAASKQIQRSWRGYRSRKETKQIWRREWDLYEQSRYGQEDAHSTLVIQGTGHNDRCEPYQSAEDCHKQMRTLLHFLDILSPADRVRLIRFGQALQRTLEVVPSIATGDAWTLPLFRISRLALEALHTLRDKEESDTMKEKTSLLSTLIFLSKLIPKQMARNGRRYYMVLAEMTSRHQIAPSYPPELWSLCEEAVLALLTPITSETLTAYTGFGIDFLTLPEVLSHLQADNTIAPQLNFKMLAATIIQELEKDQSAKSSILGNSDRSLWLLVNLVYLHQNANGKGGNFHVSQETDLIKILSTILNARASEITARIDITDRAMENSAQRKAEKTGNLLTTPLAPFIRDQIMSLVQKESIVGLMSQMELTDSKRSISSEAGQALASYALTLTRVFPRRASEIRMWLYEGSATLMPSSGSSAIVYFWHFSRSTSVFRKISRDYHNATPLLRQFLDIENDLPFQESKAVQQEWRTLLLFLELYSFAINFMDDEEFLAGGRFESTASTQWGSKIRESSLPLQDVKDLVVFLKNLAFSLYWNARDLQETEGLDFPVSLGAYFGSAGASPTKKESSRPDHVSHEATRIQLRDLVTGLLRSIHQRDSRRKFFAEDFWLMSSHLDMSGFIAAVVEEEERKQEVQDGDEDDDDFEDIFATNESESRGDSRSYHPTSSTDYSRNARRLRDQKNARNKRMLEAVAPRHEILRNLPFFILFDTRLAIFREFIARDQARRRGGFTSPDTWRLAHHARSWQGGLHADDILERHRAEIQRGQIFSSAFEQFDALGEGLKEPIQITFVDKFGDREAGIDGGGVTKEFLTSLTGEIFDPDNPEQLFVTNDENLLYPNPGKLDSQEYLLQAAGIQDRTPEMKAAIEETLSHYRFLGRIIGKCLYEGFLIDATFAGNFLLRWALTGGTTQAAQESGYHATVDDLRDLDESLYQGILKLKHYPGDVESDFGLNFTVTDTFEVDSPSPSDPTRKETKSVTRPLKLGGADIAVTNSNRPEYIYLLANHRLRKQSQYQTNAFLRGLREIIQPMWLSMFNQSEMQHLVGGDTTEIDVEDLRRHTMYSGVYVIGNDRQEHPTIKLFWEVLEQMEDQDRRKVIKFVTSTPRAPLGGFGHLNPKFTIRDSVGSRNRRDSDGPVGYPRIEESGEARLPSTSTCVNLLKLPRYPNARVMREKLLYAVNSGAGFDLS